MWWTKLFWPETSLATTTFLTLLTELTSCFRDAGGLRGNLGDMKLEFLLFRNHLKLLCVSYLGWHWQMFVLLCTELSFWVRVYSHRASSRVSVSADARSWQNNAWNGSGTHLIFYASVDSAADADAWCEYSLEKMNPFQALTFGVNSAFHQFFFVQT